MTSGRLTGGNHIGRIAENPLHSAVGVHDVAGTVADQKAQRHGFDQAMKPSLTRAQCDFCRLAVAPRRRLFQLTFDRWNEARHVLLGHIVLGSGAHGLDRALLPRPRRTS